MTQHRIIPGWTVDVALAGLCAAYLQGGLNKLLAFNDAIAEQVHFGIPAPAVFAAATIATELIGSVLVISGRWRWLGALWLAGFTVIATFLANAFWALPSGEERFHAANSFFEHIGLIGGFLLVAIMDLNGGPTRSKQTAATGVGVSPASSDLGWS